MTLAPTPQSPTPCPMSSQNTSGSTLWLAGCSSTSPSPRWAHAHARTRTRTRTQPHKHWYTQRNLNEWKCNKSSKKLHCRCSKWHPITGSQTPLLLRKTIAAVLLDCSDTLGVKKCTLDDTREESLNYCHLAILLFCSQSSYPHTMVCMIPVCCLRVWVL